MAEKQATRQQRQKERRNSESLLNGRPVFETKASRHPSITPEISPIFTSKPVVWTHMLNKRKLLLLTMHLIMEASPPNNEYSQTQVMDLGKGALPAIKSAPEAAQGILLIVVAPPQQPEHQRYSHPEKPKDRGRESRRSRGQANGRFNLLMGKKSTRRMLFESSPAATRDLPNSQPIPQVNSRNFV